MRLKGSLDLCPIQSTGITASVLQGRNGGRCITDTSRRRGRGFAGGDVSLEPGQFGLDLRCKVAVLCHGAAT